MTSEFNPEKSMFGKHRYLTEQMILGNAQGHLSKGMFVIDPMLIRVNFPFISLISIEHRKKMARKHFGNALKSLKELGVK